MTGTLLPGTPPFSTHREPGVQLLLDRLAIEDLFYTYAANVDRRNFVGVAACFASDVHGPFGGTERKNREELVEFISGVRFFHTTMHMMGNLRVDVRGDTARLDADAMIKHRGALADGQDFQLNMSGSAYAERLERSGEAWSIVERALAPASAPGRSGPREPAERSDGPAVRWLQDRAEIQDLLTSYAVAVDRRDFPTVRACFSEHPEASYLGQTFEAIAQLMEFIQGVSHFGFTRHLLARPTIELDFGAGHAATDVLALITTRMPNDEKGKRERTTAAHYRDELVRTDGRFRIAKRHHGAEPTPLIRASQRPTSNDPAVGWLLDRAAISDCILDHATALDAADEKGSGVQHFVGNQLVAIDADEAVAETYVYQVHSTESGRTSPWHEHAQRWEDRLVRQDGAWRIAEHHVRSNQLSSTPD